MRHRRREIILRNGLLSASMELISNDEFVQYDQYAHTF